MDRKCGSAKMPRFLASGWKQKDAQTATTWRLVREFGGNPFSRNSGPAREGF